MKKICLLLALSLCSITNSSAQSPELLKDINTFRSGLDGPTELVTFNGYVYFVREDSTNGSQIWRTDGTTTELFTDIDNDTYGNPFSLTAWGGSLYFSTSITGIWSSDGTSTNTLAFSSASGSIIPGSTVIFIYNTSTDPVTQSISQTIYVSDGATGASVVKAMSAYFPTGREIVPVDDDLYFVDTSVEEGKEVFYADVTDDGGGDFSVTITVLDNVISGAIGSEPASLTSFNGKCYWVALKDNSSGNGTGPKGLYESDGTLVGTTEFFAYNADAFSEMSKITTAYVGITTVGGYLLYYDMSGNVTFGYVKTVYSYDGTNPIITLQTYNVSAFITYFNRISFAGLVNGNRYLSIPGVGNTYTDGTSMTSTALSVIGLGEYLEFGSDLISSKYDGTDYLNLYKTNLSGTETLILDFESELAYEPKDFTILGGEVFFTAADDIEGMQIWKTDGTAINTTRVTTSTSSTTKSSNPQNFTVYNNELYFNATGQGTNNLYKTDGTGLNTIEVINNSESLSSDGVILDNAYYYAANNVLKKMDGSTISTISTLESTISNLTLSGNTMYFTSTSASAGTELWVSDGTALGTEALDLFTGASFSSSPDQLVDVNGVLYFRAVDPNEGTKGLWKSEGTLGTSSVVFSDIIGDIHEIATIGDQVFFTVDDLIIGEELKVYNTLSDEVTEIDLLDGAGDGFPEHLTVFNGYLYLTYQKVFNLQILIKLNPADLSYATILNLNVTQLQDIYSDFITTSSFFSFMVRDFSTNFSKRITVSKNDLISYPVNESWPGPIVVDDIVYYEKPGVLYETDGLSSKEIGTIGGQKAGFNNFLYYSYDNGSLGMEPHKYASARHGLNLTNSSDVLFAADGSSLNVSWTSGTGDGRLLIASTGSYLNLTDIVNGELYPSDPRYGNSTTSLAAGTANFSSHVVASGDLTAATVTDLTPGSTYYFTIIEYKEIGTDDFNYDLHGAITVPFTLEKAAQTISFTNPGETLATATLSLDATSTSALAVTYQVSGPAVISGSELVFNGSGEVTLTLNQSGNSVYNAAEEVLIVFDVVKDVQVITVDIPETATYLDDPISFTAATNSANISLIHSITGPGQLSSTNDEITITGAGTIEVTISNEGSTLYNPLSVTKSIAVAKADHTLTLGTIDNVPYNTSVTLLYGVGLDIIDTAPAGSFTGEITISIVSGPAEVNPVNTLEITTTGIGTVTYEVSNVGNDNFNPAPTVQGSFEAVKANQEISVVGTIPSEISFGDGSYSFENKFNTLSGEVSLIILDGPGFLSGEKLDLYTINGTGTVTLSASAPSTEFYNGSIESIEIIIDVLKSDQNITFDGITGVTLLTNIVYDPNGFELNATASSELGVSYEITGFNEASGTLTEGGSLTDNLLTITSAGSFEITITQAGDENYNAASAIVQLLSFVKADQTISATEIPDKLKSDNPFSIEAESSSGLGLTYEITIIDFDNISLEGNIITIDSEALAGRAQVSVFQSGNDVYNAAVSVNLSFCISPVDPILVFSDPFILSDNQVDQHEWYRDGEFLQLSSNSDNIFTPIESGTYTAIAQGGACPSSTISNEIVFEEVILSLESESKTLVYPVPAKDFLNISSSVLVNKNLTYKIFNLSGIQVLSGKVTRQLDIKVLESGVFFLQFSDGIEKISFIKQ